MHTELSANMNTEQKLKQTVGEGLALEDGDDKVYEE
jgi:hypothetical protein